ncbi:MAG TPA: IS1595 family transposase, partial [Gammaproteobacteria bacterium]|nr:IS1595 family transposase [Gammaproteobacteria bacterium]
YVGGKPRYRSSKNPRGTAGKQPVMAMVERGGRVRSLVVPDVSAKTLRTAIRQNIDRRARIMTDEAAQYTGLENEFEGGHETVLHTAREYARGDVSTNTVEGYFSILKRGLNGIYHSVSRKHLHRYLAEYEFRYNNRELEDGERVVAAIRASDGRRLRYREPADAQTSPQPTQLTPDF